MVIVRVEIPPLVGAKGAAEILGVSPQNMPNAKRARFFPDPATMIDGKPYWLKSDIEDYARKRKGGREE